MGGTGVRKGVEGIWDIQGCNSHRKEATSCSSTAVEAGGEMVLLPSQSSVAGERSLLILKYELCACICTTEK